VVSGNTPPGSWTGGGCTGGSGTVGNCAEADSDNKVAKMRLQIRTEENHLVRRIIQYESMTNTPEEIGERIVELLPRLRRFARSLSRNQHDADDLVQSGIERAWRNLAQFRPGANLASWMFGIMKHAWIDNLRTRRRRGEVALPEDSGEHPAVSPVDSSTELWSVSEAMSKLPEEQRLAIALVLVEGMSYKEAAEVLEIPMGTLTSRLARGRTALAAALAGNGNPL
jgi:RNA polymerase sigma-70 factor (ECF subfamily)